MKSHAISASLTPRAVALLLVALTLALYAQVVRFDFITLDDLPLVLDNPYIRSGFTSSSLRWALTADLTFDSDHVDYWQPMTLMTRILDVSLFGLHPAGHHFTNLLFHAANVVLLFYLFMRLNLTLFTASLATALFAAHPVHAASVAWIAERKDGCSLFWALLATHAWIASGGTRRRRVLAGACFLLALLSKPMMMTLPSIWLLLDLAILRRRVRAGEYAALFAFSATSAWITFRSQSDVFLAPDRILFLQKIVVALAKYPARLFLPVHLSAWYPAPESRYPPYLWVICVLFLAIFSLLAWRHRRRWPFLLTGWAWFLLGISPVVGAAREETANRFLYFPAIGIYYLFAEAAARLPKNTRAPFAALVILSVSIAGWIEIGHWKNTETLMTHALSSDPENFIARLHRAGSRMEKGNSAEALAEIDRITGANRDQPLVLYMRGRILEKLGDAPGAEEAYASVLRISPDMIAALQGLAQVKLMIKKETDALLLYRRALELRPGDPFSANGLGVGLMILGRHEEALRQFEVAIAHHPDAERVHLHMAVCRLLMEDFPAFLLHLEEAPGGSAALAVSYIRSRSDGQERLKRARRWFVEHGHEELAAIMAEQGG